MAKLLAAVPMVLMCALLALLGIPEHELPADAPVTVSAKKQVNIGDLIEVQERREEYITQASRDYERQVQRIKERKAEARAEARAERQAARQAEREAEAQAETEAEPAVQSSGGSGNLPDLLLTIRANESGGNYQAYNPDGCEGYGCYGAYQLHGRYMGDWAAEAGYGQYSGTPATQWPPEVQDAVALYKFNQTGGGLWCDWTDYC